MQSNSGRIPLDPLLTKCVEEGGNFITQYKGSEVERAVHRISHRLIQNKGETQKQSTTAHT